MMYEWIPEMMREASDIILSAHEIDKTIECKAGEANFVTAYDVAVQNFICERIRATLPEAVIIGEESDKNPMEALAKKLCVILDPIDGTTNFIHNYRASAISVGVCDGGCMVYGAVYNPYQDRMYVAERGHGAFLQSGGRTSPIHVSERELPNALSCFGTSPYYREELCDATFARAKWLFLHTHDIRRSGSAALDLASIASGAVDIFFEYRLSPWDFAAGSLLIEEAGGVITQFDGSPVTLDCPCSILAGNRPSYEAVLGEFQGK
ncbi:MAG: inositol monophosphatase family protein [Eubacteriales bacterium]